MQTGMPQQSGEPGNRHSPTRTWVAEPPPFGVASARFPNEAQKDTPDYHVAYRDVTQPPRWTAKGWVGIDDYVKPRRGTAPSVYGTSSLVPPSGPPRHGTGLASLSPSCPNEVRLQELLMLQRRRVTPEPGPGAYEPRDLRQHRRFRRKQDPLVDGPFFLDQLPDGTTTRSKEIAPLLRTAGDSGLGPGDYEGLITKDKLMRSAPVFKLSTSDRDGRTHHAKSLSISRSIQNGIDWHVPVIVQPATGSPGAPPEELRPGSPDTAAASDASPPSTAGPLTASTPRPSTAERALGLYGGPSRSSSPTGNGGAEHYVGVPPSPPSQVSRAVRREQQRRPGDWDWNRLGANYRTTWTTLHGGAYSLGDHTPPRLVPVTAPNPGASTTAASQPSLSQGIYPILEESSSAIRTDPSAEKQQQPQQQPYYVATFPVAGGGEQGGATLPGNGGSRGKPLVTEEDLRRRRAAAEFAGRAQQANTRVTDWQSKFAG